MKIHEFRNSKGQLVFSANAYDKDFKEQVEKFFGKGINVLNKELAEFNYITKDGETYTMSVMFLDFTEEEC